MEEVQEKLTPEMKEYITITQKNAKNGKRLEELEIIIIKQLVKMKKSEIKIGQGVFKVKHLSGKLVLLNKKDNEKVDELNEEMKSIKKKIKEVETQAIKRGEAKVEDNEQTKLLFNEK